MLLRSNLCTQFLMIKVFIMQDYYSNIPLSLLTNYILSFDSRLIH